MVLERRCRVPFVRLRTTGSSDNTPPNTTNATTTPTMSGGSTGMDQRIIEADNRHLRHIDLGRPECDPPFADNSIKTSRFTLLSFFPLAIRDQFRRNGNIYFLCIGLLMFLGYYTSLFHTSVSPWTTLGPLALVVSISLLQEACSDVKRHRSDILTNYHPCVVLRRAEMLEDAAKRSWWTKTVEREPHLNDGKDLIVSVAGHDTRIAFETVRRMNIHAGDLVVLRNREMIPADLILLASANEGGNAYIETSSIDGETNLKLRNSPPIQLNGGDATNQSHGVESMKQAAERIANISVIGHPHAISALSNPANADECPILEQIVSGKRGRFGKVAPNETKGSVPTVGESATYIATLTSERPNTHVNNYIGKLTLPPDSEGGRSVHAPLNIENVLLRGAVLRNTEWIIGVVCFTGADTKLVMNSVATPSKFSQMDVLINRTVFLVLFIMLICVCSLGAIAVYENKKCFDQLWYTGFSTATSDPWPYFNLGESSGIGSPEWEAATPNWIQSTIMFITLLSNFVPLALYVSVEITTVIMMQYIGWDLHMYHKESNTPAVARTSIVSDLGLVEYIFSDKTGTLTCNRMSFRRCSVDGHVFGMPVSKVASQHTSSVHPLTNLLANSGSASCLPSIPDAFSGLEDKLSFNAEMFLRVLSICHTVVVEKDHVAPMSVKARKNTKKKKEDGAPAGFVYQAESPDELALVSAASNHYGFQLIGRNAYGVQIACPFSSLLENSDIVCWLKDGSLSAKIFAAVTSASPAGASSRYSRIDVDAMIKIGTAPRIETWAILAINKFDSDRKRMSVLVQSPPELGWIHMLLCKGADSSMLIEEVCRGSKKLCSSDKSPFVESEADSSEIDNLLGLQTHLGEFASEGLRTLVLGVKILSKEDAEVWLTKYKAASTSIENRDKKMTAVAVEIERDLHIVGATALEDKLQDGVPETIANLKKAGIKLWVLTGDKRETAIEIGYSTKVLTSTMSLTEVVDGPAENVRALVSMEFMRHVKIGNLPDYQFSALDATKTFSFKSILNCVSLLDDWWRKIWLAWRRIYLTIKRLFISKRQLEILIEEEDNELRATDPSVQRRKVRELAQATIKTFWDNPKHAHLRDKSDHDDLSILSDDPPAVFERAKVARESLNARVQKLALSKISTTKRDVNDDESISSYLHPQQSAHFHRPSVLEKVFSVDKDVRHGKLTKHLRNGTNALPPIDEHHAPSPNDNPLFDVSSVKRGLVVEGSALKHLLGDPILEEMLFAVASCSDSVIACRVSPIQKALLLKMVRKYVSPTPITLAIGDGANDVPMIQEAHIGVGISGLEGTQAVNSSDFAIAQFRYLEQLLLIHGRWNFMRFSKLILYFFYKNAALVGILMLFMGSNLYSGTPLVDPWVISMFNFVGGTVPIIFSAIFDRDLPREYVLSNPQVYAASQDNEFLSLRMNLRWTLLTMIHASVIYFLSQPVLKLGGGVSSAFFGLMGNWGRDVPGDGEGGDLQVFGTTIYSSLICVVTFKALLETRSIVWGEFPAFTCRRNKGEGWKSRVAWSWVGLSWCSILFYIVFLYVLAVIGFNGPVSGTFFNFVEVSIHVVNTRSITWMVSMLLIPTITLIIDVTGKVFSNMFYPTQTQIHMEIAGENAK